MRKRILAIVLLSFCLMFAGCGHEHVWQAATCVSPKICPECGETEGDALGHKWIDATCVDAKICEICLNTMGQPLGHKWVGATCTEPRHCEACGAAEGELLEHEWVEASCAMAMHCANCNVVDGEPLEHSWVPATCTESETCSVCTKKQGKALGHNYQWWTLSKVATCTVQGTETSKCTVCGEVGERKTNLADHIPGQWTISVKASPEGQGTKVRRCTKCDKLLETQKYDLTASEVRQYYDTEYQSISYENLSRYPDNYEGEKVKFTGKVVQVCSEAKSALYYSTYRVATSGSYNNVVYIYVDNYGSGRRILEDDWITFYGVYDGLFTYETVMGASVTIPQIKVDHII